MKKAIFITARTGSARLPKKCLLKINGLTIIEHLIKRVKRSRVADIIILCTTELEEDDILCQIASKEGIEYFRGPVKDKLMRWYGAAIKFDVEFFVTADGDDVFCEPELIDLAFEQYERNHPDSIEAGKLPCGSFTYGVKTAALKKLCEIKNTDDTEMLWVYLRKIGLFKIETLQNVPSVFKRPEIRMTLDYDDDFQFFKEIMEYFRDKKEVFSLRDIINFLDRNPRVIKINQHLQEKYLNNQKKRMNISVKKGSICYGR